MKYYLHALPSVHSFPDVTLWQRWSLIQKQICWWTPGRICGAFEPYFWNDQITCKIFGYFICFREFNSGNHRETNKMALTNKILSTVKNENSSGGCLMWNSIHSLDIQQVGCEIVSLNQKCLSSELSRLCSLIAMVLERCLSG